MGWDRGRYYSRSKKVNGRVVRDYVGTGLIASIAAQVDALERSERAGQRAARLNERDRFDGFAAPVNELDALGDLLATGALMAAGYHRHHRGEWRKKRG